MLAAEVTPRHGGRAVVGLGGDSDEAGGEEDGHMEVEGEDRDGTRVRTLEPLLYCTLERDQAG